MYAGIKIMLLFTCISTHVIYVGAVYHDEEKNAAYIPEYILDILQEALKAVGHIGTRYFLTNKLNEWKNAKINVGVIGNSGVGKSSFINAIRGLTADDNGAAEVGVVATTKEPKSYKHPNNDNLLWWDLPGKSSLSEYLDVIEFDYFIIISSTRFTENDLRLAGQLTRNNIKFYFVRSKIVMDIENDRKSHPKMHDKKKVLNMVRDECKKTVERYTRDVYLIDSYETDKYDFEMLLYKLVIDAPALKREAVMFTLKSFSEEMILIKKKALMERIYIIALVHALEGAIQMGADVRVLNQETNFYTQQFGLPDQDQSRIGDEVDLIVGKLMLRDVVTWGRFIAKGITYMTNLCAGSMGMFLSETILSYVEQVIGSIVNSIASYTGSYYYLKSLLDKTAEDALKIAESINDNYD